MESHTLSPQIFEENIKVTHPRLGSPLYPPSNTIIIEAVNGRNRFFHYASMYIYITCGDHHLKISANNHVIHHKNNINLMTHKCGNGTLCQLKGIKLKEGKYKIL